MHISAMKSIGHVDIAGCSPAVGCQTSAGVGEMRQYHSPDGAAAAAFFVSLTSRHVSCFDKKKQV